MFKPKNKVSIFNSFDNLLMVFLYKLPWQKYCTLLSSVQSIYISYHKGQRSDGRSNSILQIRVCCYSTSTVNHSFGRDTLLSVVVRTDLFKLFSFFNLIRPIEEGRTQTLKRHYYINNCFSVRKTEFRYYLDVAI